MASAANSNSIIRMRNIESFPDIELLWLMNLFAHADGHSTCKPYAVRVESRNGAYLDSICRRRDEVARGHFEHCWFDDPIAFREAQAKYGRLLRNTYCMVNLSVVRGEAVDNDNVLTVVLDGVWSDQDFMLRRIVNVVFTVDCTPHVHGWIAIQDVLEKQIVTLPSLERLAVQVFRSSSNGDAADDMARFLAFSLQELVKARRIMVEVHCLLGSMAFVETLLR